MHALGSATFGLRRLVCCVTTQVKPGLLAGTLKQPATSENGNGEGVRPVKAVILAGGLGTRICEESHLRPKPMIEIGGRPILWHIMKTYGHFGITEFVICCGYKGYMIKEYFANYFLHMSDVTIDLSTNSMEVHNRASEPWKVTMVDTGALTQTGGRIRRVAAHLTENLLPDLWRWC